MIYKLKHHIGNGLLFLLFFLILLPKVTLAASVQNSSDNILPQFNLSNLKVTVENANLTGTFNIQSESSSAVNNIYIHLRLYKKIPGDLLSLVNQQYLGTYDRYDCLVQKKCL
jgi:hypothetical protein